MPPRLQGPTASPWLVPPLLHRAAGPRHLSGPAICLSALRTYGVGIASQPFALSAHPTRPLAIRFRSAGGDPLRTGSSARSDRGRLLASSLEAMADPSRPPQRPLGSDASRSCQLRQAPVETDATAMALSRKHPTVLGPAVQYFHARRLPLLATARLPGRGQALPIAVTVTDYGVGQP